MESPTPVPGFLFIRIKCNFAARPNAMEDTTFISLQEFTSLYAEYSRRFTDIAFSYLQDRQEAEDVVSESFMTFWNGRENAAPAQNLPGYILGIVKHKCLDALRSRESSERRCRNIYQQACQDAKIRVLQNDELTEKLFEDEIIAIFERELAKMPAQTAAIFQASRVEGKTYKEIADSMGIPVRTVTREIQRGLAHLRRSMKDYLPLALLLISLRG